MAYRFFLKGIEIQCDNLNELLEAVREGVDTLDPSQGVEQADVVEGNLQQTAEAVKGYEIPQKKKKKANGTGPRMAWEKARELAKKEGISDMEAHGRLAREKAVTAAAHKPKKGKQGNGPKRAWAEAAAYAEEHKISVIEARGILSARKKAAIQAAMDALQG